MLKIEFQDISRCNKSMGANTCTVQKKHRQHVSSSPAVDIHLRFNDSGDILILKIGLQTEGLKENITP